MAGETPFQDAAQLLASIVDSSDDAILSKDLKGIITSWNRGAQRIFGYTPEEAIGESALILVPSDRVDEEAQILERIRQGLRMDHVETIRQTREGKLVHVSETISPLKDATGRVVGASKIARDITARKEAELALADAQRHLRLHAQELEEQVKERTNTLRKTVEGLEAFSYSLSHDMRAPLRAIQGFLQIFQDDHSAGVDAAGLALIKKVIGTAQRMDRMLIELLEFTRLSQMEMGITAVDVERQIQEIVQERIDLQPPRAIVTVAYPLPQVMGHEATLHQCLVNLLDNAVKFVAPGVQPCVRVHAENRGEMVRLCVKDNGIGISADGQAQLFGMFQRLHANDYPGTGIGLAIARKAIERMGGTVGVESETDKGSRFWLELPRATP